MKNAPQLEYLDYQFHLILMSWASRTSELLSGLSYESSLGYSAQSSATVLTQITDTLVPLGKKLSRHGRVKGNIDSS